MMTPAVYPVSGEIDNDERNDICKPGSRDVINSDPLNEPGIGNNGYCKTQYVFGNISNATCKTGYHIHIADRVFLLPPSIPFFKKYQEQKGWHSNQQYLSVGFHTIPK